MFRSIQLFKINNLNIKRSFCNQKELNSLQGAKRELLHKSLPLTFPKDNNSNFTSQTIQKYDVFKQPLDMREKLIKYGLSTVLFPLTLFGFFTVPAKHKAVITNFGKYQEIVNEGLHWRSPFGFEFNKIFVGKNSYNLPKSKIVDKNGNPIIISGTINYSIENPEKYAININADDNFIKNQAEVVLKKVTSEYPYQSDDQKCLIREGEEVKNRMIEELQKLVENAGIKIEDFFLTDICYAPEIAQQMLMKQRAMAYIEAKDKIGNASIEIIQKMINDIDNKLGVKLTDERKSQMINNLLIVMTSENQSQPVLQLESGEKDMKINNNFEDILNKQNKLLKDILNKIKE